MIIIYICIIAAIIAFAYIVAYQNTKGKDG